MPDSPPRKIIHVDMDAFYASVEQRDDPDLRGRPVAVGYAARRGVVAAASYEARPFEVRPAMPATTALRRCPDLVFVPLRFEVYRAVSRQILAIFADYTALIEPLSLDEAYLDVTENRRRLTTASASAKEIRRRILAETGLTASAGISYNKFLAKLASDYRKPNGQFVVSYPAVMTSHDQLLQASIDLIRSLLPPAKGIRLVGVTVSNFGEPSAWAGEELPLFEAPGSVGHREDSACELAMEGPI